MRYPEFESEMLGTWLSQEKRKKQNQKQKCGAWNLNLGCEGGGTSGKPTEQRTFSLLNYILNYFFGQFKWCPECKWSLYRSTPDCFFLGPKSDQVHAQVKDMFNKLVQKLIQNHTCVKAWGAPKCPKFLHELSFCTRTCTKTCTNSHIIAMVNILQANTRPSLSLGKHVDSTKIDKFAQVLPKVFGEIVFQIICRRINLTNQDKTKCELRVQWSKFLTFLSKNNLSVFSNEGFESKFPLISYMQLLLQNGSDKMLYEKSKWEREDNSEVW